MGGEDMAAFQGPGEKKKGRAGGGLAFLSEVKPADDGSGAVLYKLL
jgi:hypothetical protein